MRKEAIGKLAIKISVYLGLIAIVSLFFVLRPQSDDPSELTRISMIRFTVYFYVFSFLIPAGAITYEWLVVPHIHEKMIRKAIISSIVVVLGTILIFVFWTLILNQLVMLIGLLTLAYTIMPTVKRSE